MPSDDADAGGVNNPVRTHVRKLEDMTIYNLIAYHNEV